MWNALNIEGRFFLISETINTKEWLAQQYYLVLFDFVDLNIVTVHLANAITNKEASRDADIISKHLTDNYPWFDLENSAIVICKDNNNKGIVVNDVIDISFKKLFNKFRQRCEGIQS